MATRSPISHQRSVTPAAIAGVVGIEESVSMLLALFLSRDHFRSDGVGGCLRWRDGHRPRAARHRPVSRERLSAADFEATTAASSPPVRPSPPDTTTPPVP